MNRKQKQPKFVFKQQIKKFPAGKKQEYGGLPGITFRGTSNPDAQKPENIWGMSSVVEWTMNSEPLREAFTSSESMGKYPDPKLPPPWKPFKILASSWMKEDPAAFNDRHGLTGAILKAYNQHHALVLRPDNFWQAILTQFSFYINANAEELRDRIVSHQGQKELTVREIGSLTTYNYASMINRMVEEQIKPNIKDETVADWLIPSFTTTTPTDKVAAGVSVMSALQQFFIYRFGGGCGLPFVTLLGEIEDWEILRAKIDRLLEFELEGKTYMQQWHEWLAHILDQLVESAKGNPDLHFWETCIKHQPNTSAMGYVCGWMSTFNVFTSQGKWQATNFIYREPMSSFRDPPIQTWFPVIDPDNISSGVCKVPVLVEDPLEVWNECWLFAGQFRSNPHKNNTLYPTTDWYIAIEDKEVEWTRPKWIHPKNRGKSRPKPVYIPSWWVEELAKPKPVPDVPKLPFSFRPNPTKKPLTAKQRKHFWSQITNLTK